ncbi:MAG TPA: FmdB family zinc ribbon protein [Thermomicrobiales bacterium]|jgi:putative FmdB family regulatory protein|nr:FmdB family zinc ribbon protein [Thermomicrobiales bacterium]
MPTYAYRCRDCGHQFDIVQKFSDDALTVCPTCEGHIHRVIQRPGVVFKGSGFYINDSKSSGKDLKDGKPRKDDASDASDASDAADKPAASSDSGDALPATGTDRSAADKPAAKAVPADKPAKKTPAAVSS